MKNNDPSRHYKSYLYIGCVWVVIVLIMLFLTSCGSTSYHIGTGQKMNKKCGQR